MKSFVCLTAAAALLTTGSAFAAGELRIFSWGNYTSPELIAKFENEHGVKVVVDTFDSNETMISKVRQGSSGYDVVVPSDYAVKIMVDDGLLEKTEPNKMENFKNVDRTLVDLYFDEGRNYTVPWQVGITAFQVDTAVYGGDIDTYAILFDPPAELRGRINMLDDMVSVIHAAEAYKGFSRCTADKDQLREVNDLLTNAKPHWRTFSYDGPTLLASRDVDASMIWNGAAIRARADRATLKFAFPREALEGFMDNVAVLKGAPNLENAKLFQNFIMDPQNAAMISNFAKYNSGIVGAREFEADDVKNAPELKIPEGRTPGYTEPCSAEVIDLYNRIWTNLRK